VVEVTVLEAPPLPPQSYARVCMYVEARACAIATLWQRLKAIGTEWSEIFSGTTASSRDTDVLYRRLHARNVREGCDKIWKQSVQKFLSCDRRYKQTYPHNIFCCSIACADMQIVTVPVCVPGPIAVPVPVPDPVTCTCLK
jgi:hypothetical protein